MKNIAIETNPFFIYIYDTFTNSGYTFPIIKSMTEMEVIHRFRHLTVKCWMNPQTLEALKEEIIKVYPRLNINWVGILDEVKNAFKIRVASSVHVGFKNFGPG